MAGPAYRFEKTILSELLKMYRDATCLWNPTHPHYSNKVSRRRALLGLQEKFRELDPGADLHRLKKKLENMRTTYKRERAKVKKSTAEGGEPFEPSLWYYPHMAFLDALEGAGGARGEGCGEGELCDSDADGDDYDTEPPEKKFKSYITDEHQYENKSASNPLTATSEDEERPYVILKTPTYESGQGSARHTEDPFAKALAARLEELRPQQRFIAEKLLSDVIFLGRLNKLRTGSAIAINEDI